MNALDGSPPRRSVTLPTGTGLVLSLSAVATSEPAETPALRLTDGDGPTVHVLAEAPTRREHLVWSLDLAAPATLDVSAAGVEVTDAVVYGPDVLDVGVTLVDLDHEPPRLLGPGTPLRAEGDDPWRPAYHFTPQRGWMNDPNGLTAVGDRVHMFFQADPHGTAGGNKHWGHAVSEDLLRWRHLPTALYPHPSVGSDPEVLGGAYSGSGLLVDDTLRLFYTEHLESRDQARYLESQRVAVSHDEVHVRPGATLVPGPPDPSVGRDFRDPKVWREDDGSYAMVLGSRVGGVPAVLIYRSDDARTWRYAGVLHREAEVAAQTMECPDFFVLDGVHVLVAGMLGSLDPDTGRRHLSYAWVGDYDGSTFTVRARHELDAGPDLYALQTFLRGGRRYAMAWMDNWDRPYPTRPYGWVGAMALPRALSVRDDRLHLAPAPETTALRARVIVDEAGPVGPVVLPGSAVEILVVVEGAFDLELTNEVGDSIIVEYGADGVLLVGGPGVGGLGVDRPWTRVGWVGLRELRIFLDRSSVEVLADDGALSSTSRVYPRQPWSRLTVRDGEHTRPRRVAVWELSLPGGS